MSYRKSAADKAAQGAPSGVDTDTSRPRAQNKALAGLSYDAQAEQLSPGVAEEARQESSNAIIGTVTITSKDGNLDTTLDLYAFQADGPGGVASVPIGKELPKLYRAVNGGEPVTVVVRFVRRSASGGESTTTLTYSDAVLSRMEIAGSSGGDVDLARVGWTAQETEVSRPK